jgi:hypothetical protein
LAERVRRAEYYAVLGAEVVVVELHRESYAAKPSTHLGDHPPRPARPPRHLDREQRGDRHRVERTSRTDRPHGPRDQIQEREVVGDTR